MNRTQARENLVSIGITDPTDEQITNYLNQVHGESSKEKTRADKYKADADKMAELQKQLDAINDEKLTEVQKAQKDLETANNRIAELEKAQQIANLKATVAEKFKVTGEQASQIIKEDGTLDYDVLSKIISDKETAAASAKEQEIAGKQGNPGGASSGGKKDPEETDDVVNARSITFAQASKEQKSAIDYYTK